MRPTAHVRRRATSSVALIVLGIVTLAAPCPARAAQDDACLRDTAGAVEPWARHNLDFQCKRLARAGIPYRVVTTHGLAADALPAAAYDALSAWTAEEPAAAERGVLLLLDGALGDAAVALGSEWTAADRTALEAAVAELRPLLSRDAVSAATRRFGGRVVSWFVVGDREEYNPPALPLRYGLLLGLFGVLLVMAGVGPAARRWPRLVDAAPALRVMCLVAAAILVGFAFDAFVDVATTSDADLSGWDILLTLLLFIAVLGVEVFERYGRYG